MFFFSIKKEEKTNKQVRGNDGTIKKRKEKKKKRAILGGGLGIQEEIWELCPRCEKWKPLISWLLDSRGSGNP